ncbi:MAG: hypothetical protein KGS09_07480 [Nitrospirae bacterium]|nr:hypothetical protein [Nitrospirota bacterium]MBU6480371.1 hypothetical protein [Nitrospirota bacterium]MDE3039769.1 hypothetical protein [Nitrospirota bacterium]MDE3049784.1 hypothetical protein [Nitrospirota bacterium]MDE3219133.1 hypothetical protein [Nitrospirota bacterium]
MSHAFRVLMISLVSLIGMATLCSAQGQPQPGDMQQKLEQELANTKRSATESSSGASQSASDVKSAAEKKMEDTAAQHKSQAEGKMTEEIEKAKRRAQGIGQ